MKCLNPIRIYNRYIQQWMYVPCRHCDACRIQDVNKKTYELTQTLMDYDYKYFVTLTYNNASLPVIMVGGHAVIRGCDDFFGDILCLIDELGHSDFIGTKIPAGSVINDCVGVLYYKDLQNFFKRLRNYYERTYKRKFEFKYFGVGEFGSIRKRPHFHVLFYGQKEDYKGLSTAITECWTMCDWTKLEMADWFKIADNRASQYLASYVNNDTDSVGLYGKKGLCSKTFRSKNVNYGVTNEIRKNFEEQLRVGIFDNDICDRIQSPLTYINQEKGDNVSSCPIPSKLLSTYICKPKGCSKASYDHFCRCLGEAWFRYKTDGLKGLSSSDYKACLAYRNYLKVTGYVDNIHTLQHYELIAWQYYNWYQSLLLKQQMMEYDYRSEDDYVVKQYNSYVDNPSRRIYKLRKYYDWEKSVDLTYHPLSDSERTEINSYVDKYKYKLLTKHKHEVSI